MGGRKNKNKNKNNKRKGEKGVQKSRVEVTVGGGQIQKIIFTDKNFQLRKSEVKKSETRKNKLTLQRTKFMKKQGEKKLCLDFE